MPSIVLAPPVLETGTASEADKFLVATLWGEWENSLSYIFVVNWARILQERGDDFSSHAAACHYWLYEHYSGHDHSGPQPRAVHSSDRRCSDTGHYSDESAA